jgi:hypothetical protein
MRYLMSASEDNWLIEPADQTGREHREVYPYAGMALSQAQLLEHVLKNFIVLGRAIERRSESALTPDEAARFNAELEAFETKLLKKTLGHLIGVFTSKYHFRAKANFADDLSKSLDDRNLLVHHFFWDRAVDQQTGVGRRKMAAELKRIHAQLKGTVQEFGDATKALRVSLGATDDILDEVLVAARAGATEEQIKKIISKRRASSRV